jgi:hypothetical protein
VGSTVCIKRGSTKRVPLYYKLHNHFSKGKAELEGDLEAEALPEALTFFLKQKRRKQKRKHLGWKQKWKR